MTYQQKIFELADHFAGIALQSLIAKLPLQDRDGVFNEAKSEDEINGIKKELCEAAYNYAWHMLRAREEMQVYFSLDNILPNSEQAVQGCDTTTAEQSDTVD